MKYMYFYSTKIGEVAIAENGTAITNLYFNKNPLLCNVEIKETDLLREAAQQLKDYLSGIRKGFNLPLSPEGTAFQQKVWKALQEIPFGETRSYGQLAKDMGSPRSARAVGMSNNKNPILLFIPCHRVIGAKGNLVGYAGGLEVKKHLLEMEKANANS